MAPWPSVCHVHAEPEGHDVGLASSHCGAQYPYVFPPTTGAPFQTTQSELLGQSDVKPTRHQLSHVYSWTCWPDFGVYVYVTHS
jgi:hypothetical protein